MRSVLITGAASGFGMNAALELAAQGWRVFASMRDTAKGRSLIDKGGVDAARISLVTLDVTDPSSVAAGVDAVLTATGGTLDALLNNAGYGAIGAFEDMGDAACRQQMETNFFGALAVTRAVLPTMRAACRGRIVVLTSNAVNTPHPMLSMYAASKWALEGWAEALAMEMAPFGVEIVVVQPGAHRTPFAEHVVPLIPEGSPYREWLDVAMPGIGNLDRWGRDAGKATPAIVAAVANSAPPFRTMVGEDTAAFATLKGMLPYEVRAWAMRAIVGLPQAGAFADGEALAPPDPPEVVGEIAQRLIAAVASDPAIARLLMSIAGGSN